MARVWLRGGPTQKVTQLFDHVFMRDHLTNWNHYISTTTKTIATKSGSIMAYFEWLLPIKSHDHVIHSWQRVPTILFHEDPPIAYPSFFHVLTNPPSPTYTHPNTLPTFLDWMSNCATFDVLFYFYDIMDLHMPSLIPQGMFLLNGGIGEGESTFVVCLMLHVTEV